MYTKPHIYHVSFDIKNTQTDEEYNTISSAIQSVFDVFRSNNRCIDMLESSYLLYTRNTEEEMMNKLKNAIINEGVDTENFWCFISSVNSKYQAFCLTEEQQLQFSEWSANAYGF